MALKSAPKTLVDAVQAVYAALEPFDDAARQRILQSATALFGGTLSSAAPTPAGSPAIHSSVPRAGAERPISPVELINEKKPATNPQRIAVLAYYRERSEGMSRFARDDLKAYFAKAKQPPPQNYDRDSATF